MVTSIQLQAYKVLLFVLLLITISPAAAQQDDRAAPPKAPPRARRIFTNDDLQSPASDADEGLPHIPGLIKCGREVKCFLEALDSASPAAVTRLETVEQGTGLVTSNSTWWTAACADGRCTVSFRVDAFEAKVNEKVVPANPKASRDAVEEGIAKMNRDFAAIRGKTSTCTLAVKDLKAMMTGSSLTLMSLGPASNFGKNCSGPGFDTPAVPSLNDKK